MGKLGLSPVSEDGGSQCRARDLEAGDPVDPKPSRKVKIGGPQPGKSSEGLS